MKKQRKLLSKIGGFDNPEKLNGWNVIQSFRQFGIEALFTKEEYNEFSFKLDHKYKWKCLKCGNIFEAHCHKTAHIKECEYLPRCWKCYPRISQYSKKEKQVLEFVKSIYDGVVEENARILMPTSENNWKRKHELDIYLPDLHLGIEFNGDHFHDYEMFPNAKINDEFKRIACESQGIKLIIIWEHDWDDNKEEVEDSIYQCLVKA